MCCGVWLANILHRLERSQDTTDTCVNVEEGLTGNGSGTCNIANIDAQMINWSIFIILTLLHVWANYIGMRVLHLRTLNQERTKIALQPLIEDCGKWVLGSKKIDSTTQLINKACANILPPKSVSESLWKSMLSMVKKGNIQLGIRLKDFVRKSSNSGNWIHCQRNNEKYMIFIYGGSDTSNSRSITVMLRVDANDRDELKAFVHAHILHWCLRQSTDTSLPQLLSRYVLNICYFFPFALFTHHTAISISAFRSYEIVKRIFQREHADKNVLDLYNALGEEGWEMTRLYLGFGPWRCEWEDGI